MQARPLAQRILVSHARPRAFADKTIPLLARLGYRIHDARDWAAAEPPGAPELAIVEDARLAELDQPGLLARFAALPRIVITGARGVTGGEGVVAAVNRPAGLHDLYRVIQQVFEDTPRTTPRVATTLRVQCDHGGERFDADLLSLSENGGLLHCEAKLPLGSRFEMRLELPRTGPLALFAEAAYQLVPHVGVVFSGLAARDRDAIGWFVSEALLA